MANKGYLIPTAEEVATSDYEINSLSMEATTPIRDTEYLSDSEYSSSSNSQYYIIVSPYLGYSTSVFLIFENLII